MTKKKQKLSAEDVCVSVHTALRKCCDSHITSALYNFIHLICDRKPAKFNIWLFFGGRVANNLNEGIDAVVALKSASKKLTDAFYDSIEFGVKVRSEDLPDGTQSVMHTFGCMLMCLDDTDWEGMAAYLGEED